MYDPQESVVKCVARIGVQDRSITPEFGLGPTASPWGGLGWACPLSAKRLLDGVSETDVETQKNDQPLMPFFQINSKRKLFIFLETWRTTHLKTPP